MLSNLQEAMKLSVLTNSKLKFRVENAYFYRTFSSEIPQNAPLALGKTSYIENESESMGLVLTFQGLGSFVGWSGHLREVLKRIDFWDLK